MQRSTVISISLVFLGLFFIFWGVGLTEFSLLFPIAGFLIGGTFFWLAGRNKTIS